jgi:hypothetical protein
MAAKTRTRVYEIEELDEKATDVRLVLSTPHTLSHPESVRFLPVQAGVIGHVKNFFLGRKRDIAT